MGFSFKQIPPLLDERLCYVIILLTNAMENKQFIEVCKGYYKLYLKCHKNADTHHTMLKYVSVQFLIHVVQKVYSEWILRKFSFHSDFTSQKSSKTLPVHDVQHKDKNTNKSIHQLWIIQSMVALQEFLENQEITELIW